MNVNEKRLKDRGDKLEDIGIPRDFIDDDMNTDFAHAVLKAYPGIPALLSDSELLEIAAGSLARVWKNIVKDVKAQVLWSKRLTGYYKRYPGKNARKLRIVRKLLNT
mgnify:CR=1 FL=1